MDAKKKKGAQWSKDFVEHMRTVHFSLVVLCCGLIIAAYAERDSAPKRALKQLEQVIAISGHLDAGWLESRCRSFRSLWRADLANTLPDGKNLSALHDHFIRTDWTTVRYSFDADCRVAAPGELGGSIAQGVRVDGRYLTEIVSTHAYPDKPATLAQFRALWDFLNSDPQIIVPTEFADQWITEDGSRPPAPYAILNQKEKSVSDDAADLTLDIRRSGEAAGTSRFVFRSDAAGGFIPVTGFRNTSMGGPRRLRDVLSTVGNSNLLQGSFAQSFPDLFDLAQNRDSAAFDILRRSFLQEIGRTDEMFEAFGLKLPISTAAGWGMGLIISVQLYFLAHFSELSRRMRPSDPGWEVAWIGVYHGQFARILFDASALLLPVLSVLLLACKAWSQLDMFGAQMLIVVALSASGLLAYITHRASSAAHGGIDWHQKAPVIHEE